MKQIKRVTEKPNFFSPALSDVANNQSDNAIGTTGASPSQLYTLWTESPKTDLVYNPLKLYGYQQS